MSLYEHLKMIIMNKTLTSIVLIVCCITTFAQDKITDELKALTDSNQYDKIIEQYTTKYNDYSAKSLYYIGQAYYMKEDDNNCIKFVNLSINKYSKDPAPYYIKASTLNYMQKYDEAIQSFQAAIYLKPDDVQFYIGLGDSYYNLNKLDLALGAYKKATEQKDSPGRAYSMIAQIYSDLKDNDNALNAYYTAKTKFSKESD